MKNVDIIYSRYLAEDNQTKTIGGVQTYITDLCEVITEMGGKVRIVQFSKNDFRCDLSENVSVAGFVVKGKTTGIRSQRLYDAAVKSRDEENTLTIFATDTIIPPKVSGTCLAIQHGIFWDIPRNCEHSLIRQVASRAVSAYRIVKRLTNVQTVVCVDYNFLNWYRTQANRVAGYVSVIPNYTRIALKNSKPEDKVNIIFARRLFDYRGTRVFTQAVKRILDAYKNVTVTVAGSGPDEEWMKRQLQQYDNVAFIHYESHESLDIHADKHIAVVPTVGSEGTSLSLLEAMSAQCAVVCTNVGGMTNIVLDGYNGLMVNAGSADQLYEAMRKLVADKDMRNAIAQKGYETANCCFSYEKWKAKWTEIFQNKLTD